MCGILIIHDPNGVSDLLCKVDGALDLMAPRGPNDRGIYLHDRVILGSRRLSVIDTSDAGHQPMKSLEADAHIVFNGMIYNYKNIRKDLQVKGFRFQSNTDTETILNSYIAYGIEFVEILNGMWSAGIWDERSGRLVVTRDRFGIKPLYRFNKGSRTIFASEIKVILALLNNTPVVNEFLLHRYLMRGWLDDNPETLIEGISRVHPGSIQVIHGERTDTKRFWDLVPSMREQPAEGELRHQLMESIISQTQSDVPVGLSLSGGLDSGAIAAVIAQTKSPSDYSTYTIVPPNSVDETPRDFLSHYGFKHRTVIVEGVDLETDIDLTIDANDEPINGINTVYQYSLRRVMRDDGIKVLLTGEGADEVVGGYERTIFPYLTSLLESGDLSEASRALIGAEKLIGRSTENIIVNWIEYLRSRYRNQFFQEHEVGKGRLDIRFETFFHAMANERRIERFENIPGEDFFNNLYVHLFCRYLPLVLRMEDRISGAFGIETRVPFLDHKFVEMVWSSPFHLFMKDGQNKAILREALVGMLPPKTLAVRTKLRKPGNSAYTVYVELRSKILDLLKSSHVFETRFLASDSTEAFLADCKAKDPHRANFWLRVYITYRWLNLLQARKSTN
jgi:asparagine synthase (glutamine-hydrolysing)